MTCNHTYLGGRCKCSPDAASSHTCGCRRSGNIGPGSGGCARTAPPSARSSAGRTARASWCARSAGGPFARTSPGVGSQWTTRAGTSTCRRRVPTGWSACPRSAFGSFCRTWGWGLWRSPPPSGSASNSFPAGFQYLVASSIAINS